jgi:hypothetical protein
LNTAIQPIVTGQWQTWSDLTTTGNWWSTKAFGTAPNAGGLIGDTEPFASLTAKYAIACPNAAIVDYGVGMGSFNPGTAGWADNVMYTTSAGSENWNFENTAVPTAPTIGTATGGNANASVTFTPPVSNGSTISSYKVTASDAANPTDGGEFNSGPGSPIVVSGLTVGETYTFTVTATNGSGTGPPSDPSNAVTIESAPSAPTIGTATAGNATASVTFTAPANNGSAITGYTVTAADSTTPANGHQTGTGTSSPIAVPLLTNGDVYTFTVTATNALGTGPASAASNSVIPSTIPGAPTIGTATGGNTGASVAFTAPANNGSPITGYTVTAADSTTPANGHQTATGTSSPITVTGLTNGDSYTFTVIATNGDGPGPASAASNAVVPSTLPGAPTITSTSSGKGSATIGFSAAAGNGSPITSYTVTAADAANPALGKQTATGAQSPITVTGLVDGQSYTFTVTATNANGTGPASAPSGNVFPGGLGYWLVASDGGIFSFGDAQFFGSTGSLNLNKPIVGMIATPDRLGYLMVASDGGVFSFGDASFHGSASGIASAPIVGIAQTPDGGGYWMAGANGQVYSFGDAKDLGFDAPTFLGSNVVGIAATQDGGGYWLATANGGIVPVGDAVSYGSVSQHLNKPIVGISTTSDGKGYWLLGGDGGIFSFGDAQFFGSTGSLVLNKPVVGLTATPDGGGYWLVASDGGIFSFGDAQFFGSTGSLVLNRPVVGMAAD